MLASLVKLPACEGGGRLWDTVDWVSWLSFENERIDLVLVLGGA